MIITVNLWPLGEKSLFCIHGGWWQQKVCHHKTTYQIIVSFWEILFIHPL